MSRMAIPAPVAGLGIYVGATNGQELVLSGRGDVGLLNSIFDDHTLFRIPQKSRRMTEIAATLKANRRNG